MAKLLLITFVFSVCIYFTFGIRCDQICKNSTFEYEGRYQVSTPVNYVCTIRYQIDLMEYKEYMIDESIDFELYFNDVKNVVEMKNLRTIYNTKIMKIYSYDYTNSLKLKKIDISKDFSDIKVIFHKLPDLENKCSGHRKESFEYEIKNKIKRGFNLLASFEYYIQKDSFDTNNMTKSYEIEQLIESSKVDGKILSFQYDSIDYIYKNHQILEYNHFYLKRIDRTIFDFKSSGYLSTTIYLPFYDNWAKETDKNCLTTDELPYFYQNNKK